MLKAWTEKFCNIHFSKQTVKSLHEALQYHQYSILKLTGKRYINLHFKLTLRQIWFHRTLFAHSKKVPQEKEGLQKSYIIKDEYFEFGPLLCSKTRDRYETEQWESMGYMCSYQLLSFHSKSSIFVFRFKKNKYPENSERLVIHNDSGLEVEVKFSFLQDTQATTYLLDPPTMTLAPCQKQVPLLKLLQIT